MTPEDFDKAVEARARDSTRKWQLDVLGLICAEHLLELDVEIAEAVAANTLSSESEIVKLIQAEEEGLVNAPAAQDAMWRMINDRKPSVVGDACLDMCGGVAKGSNNEKAHKPKRTSKSSKAKTKQKSKKT